MATNEELALLIQQGHKEYISELWANCYKLLYMLSDKFYFARTERLAACGYTQEDLYQGCFFVMLKMVEAYDPEKGYKFTSYAGWHLKNYLQRTVLGYDQHVKGIRKPLNISDTIYEPIRSKKDGSDTDRLVVDTLIDDTAERALCLRIGFIVQPTVNARPNLPFYKLGKVNSLLNKKSLKTAQV